MSSESYKGLYTVIGPPGTGKTTFLASRVERAISRGEKPLVASMTKTAEREVASRKVAGVTREMIGTVHAHAYRSIGRPRVVQSSHVNEWNETYPHYQMSETDDFGAAWHSGDKLAQEMDLLRHRMVPRDAWPAHVAGFATAWQDFKDSVGVIDFTDMVEIAHRESVMAPGSPDVLMVDEAQDLSRLEYELIKKWSRWATGMMITGDPNQVLYEWRGADPSVFNDPEVPEDHRGVLRQSYRIPRAVHGVSSRWIREHLSTWAPAEFKPREFDGAVNRSAATVGAPLEAIMLAEQLVADGKTVMLCAAANYMVDGVANELRARSLPYANPWRARSRWNPLAVSPRMITAADRVYAFLKPAIVPPGDADDDGFCWRCGGNGCDACKPRPQGWSASDVWKWAKLCRAKGLLTSGGKKSLEFDAKNTPDGSGALTVFLPEHEAFLTRYVRGDVDYRAALLWLRDKLLSGGQHNSADYAIDVAHDHGIAAMRDEPKLYIGTIHSFKGSQADVVFVFPDLPHRAFLAWISGGKLADGVACAFYVAMTRAREQLYVCSPSSGKTVEVEI